MPMEQNGSVDPLIAKAANVSHAGGDMPERAAASTAERLWSVYKQTAPKLEPKLANDTSNLHEVPVAGRSTDGDLIACSGVKLRGDIASCETLTVEGEIEAHARARHLMVAACGSFVGRADVEDAEIAGRFEGTMHVAGKLIIRKTGRVDGQISYGQVEIEPGGELRGRVTAQTGGRRLNLLRRSSPEKFWSWKS